MSLSFNNGVFEAQISDASTWNVDAKIEDICVELRIYPPASMLESRKVTDDGPIKGSFGTGSFGSGGDSNKVFNDRQFTVDPPIGIRQVGGLTTGNMLGPLGSTRFNRVSTTWPVRIAQWPKREAGITPQGVPGGVVMKYKFEFFDTKRKETKPGEEGVIQPGSENEPTVASIDYSNPTPGRTELCRLNSGADSDCKLRRINNEYKGADGSTIGGTA